MMGQKQKDWWNDIASGHPVTLYSAAKLFRIKLRHDGHRETGQEGIEYEHNDTFAVH
jgi:hypothetical protein